MTNNDILRRIRYIFDFGDSKMMQLFESGGMPVTRAVVSDWLKKEEDPESKKLFDEELATFLNGLINEMRGKKEGEQPLPEKHLDNNVIFRKLRIALAFKDEDIVDVLNLTGMRVGKPEINAFFRNPSQPQYRPCKDQILRNFLNGLQLKYRGNKDE